MTPSKFFLLGFIGPLLGGGLGALIAYWGRDWLIRHGVHPWVVMFLVFIFMFVIVRRLVHSLVPVRCYKCGQDAAYEMDGISCRFRCRVCGKEF